MNLDDFPELLREPPRLLRFAGLCEFEACMGGEWDYVTPGRVGRRRLSLDEVRERIAKNAERRAGLLLDEAPDWAASWED